MFRSVMTLALSITAGTLLCTDLSAQSTDIIRLESSSGGATTVRGTIQRMNKRNITIDATGGERRIDVNEVRLVTFADEPRELREARSNLIEGRDARAYDALRTLDSSAVSNDFVRQDIDFLTAATATRLALRGEEVTLDDAKKQMDELLGREEFKEFYRYYDAVQLKGDLALALGDFTEAESRFTELSQLPWPEVALNANLQVGECQTGREAYADAIASFEKVLQSDRNSPEAQELKLMAQIGTAKALSGSGRSDDAISMLESIIKKQPSSDQQLFGKLYNALGKCYLEANKPKFAKHQFLHVDLLFNQDPENHAEALFYLVDLWAQENKIQNSNAAREMLRSRYPNSVWNNKL